MADHYNFYELKNFAATIADCMDMSLPETYAPSIDWVAEILKQRMGGPADRVVCYHADAVGQYVWQENTNIFAPVYLHTSLAIPFRSTVESVTPAAHASMYTGLDPAQHGIATYIRPQLTCDTLYDQLIAAGKRVAVVTMTDSTFLHIFKGRAMDYFECDSAVALQEKVLELIATDRYDFISVHTQDYDTASHSHGPKSKQALNMLSLEAEGFDRVARALQAFAGKHRILLSYSPDHGQHDVFGGRGDHGSLEIEDMNVLHFFGTI